MLFLGICLLFLCLFFCIFLLLVRIFLLCFRVHLSMCGCFLCNLTYSLCLFWVVVVRVWVLRSSLFLFLCCVLRHILLYLYLGSGVRIFYLLMHMCSWVVWLVLVLLLLFVPSMGMVCLCLWVGVCLLGSLSFCQLWFHMGIWIRFLFCICLLHRCFFLRALCSWSWFFLFLFVCFWSLWCIGLVEILYLYKYRFCIVFFRGNIDLIHMRLMIFLIPHRRLTQCFCVLLRLLLWFWLLLLFDVVWIVCLRMVCIVLNSLLFLLCDFNYNGGSSSAFSFYSFFFFYSFNEASLLPSCYI